jgi:hypothetical protein
MGLCSVVSVALSALSGCASWQNDATATLTGGVGDIYRAQAVSNLGRMLDREGFAPNAVTLTTGFVQTQQNFNAGANVPIGDQNTIGTTIVASSTPNTTNTTTLLQPQKGLTFGASGQLQENWTVVPVTDAGVLARIRALYEFETSTKPLSQASDDFLARYSVPIVTKEFTVPRASPGCISQMKGYSVHLAESVVKDCFVSAVADVRYPDPQSVDFPNCAVCEIVTAGEKHVSVSGLAVKLGDQDTNCFELDPKANMSVSLPLSEKIIDPGGPGNGSTVSLVRNCRLKKWLAWSDLQHNKPQWPESLITPASNERRLGSSHGHELYEIANDSSDPFGDFLLFISQAMQVPAPSASAASGGSGSGGGSK